MIGTVKGQTIGKAKNGTKQVRLLQVSLPGNDVCTVQWIGQPGTDSCPVIGSRVSVMDVMGTLYGVANQDTIVPSSNPGEVGIYSTDGLVRKAEVKCRADGTVYVGSPSTGNNLKQAMQNIVLGIQGGSYGSGAFVDTTGKLTLGMSQLNALLGSSE